MKKNAFGQPMKIVYQGGKWMEIDPSRIVVGDNVIRAHRCECGLRRNGSRFWIGTYCRKTTIGTAESAVPHNHYVTEEEARRAQREMAAYYRRERLLPPRELV